MWRKAENTIRPEDVEVGRSVVYIRKNIAEVQREVEGETVTVFVYDELKIPKELYPVFEQQQADIDYLTMIVEG